ncbi:MAG: S41 family peptidase, partial [Paracoccaceae bacterium]|nr:S41 family peptidase [Paracoccaceae bacterium]
MRFITVALAGCAIAIGGASAATAQAVQPATPIVAHAGPLIPELIGRWDLSFRSPQASLDTVWVIEPVAQVSTSVGTIGNNPVRLTVTEVRLIDGTITFTGSTSLGALTMTGRLDSDRITGTFASGPVSGDFTAKRRADGRVMPLLQIFDHAVGTFEQSLFTPAPFDHDWQARRTELRAQLESPTATERDMVQSVRALVAAARMSHNSFYIPFASETQAEAPRTTPVVTSRRLDGDIGYIRIDSFVEHPEERTRLDTAFAELADTKGLVIDLRGNSGGNLGLAMRLGDHLFPANTPSGLFATRKGLDDAGVASMDRLPASSYRIHDGYTLDQFQTVLAETGAVSLVTGGHA